MDARGHANHRGLLPLQDHNGAWLSIGARDHIPSFNEDSGAEPPSLPPAFPSQGQWALLLANEKYPSKSETRYISEGFLGQVDVSSTEKLYMGSMTQVMLFRLPALSTFYDAVFQLVKGLNSDRLNARLADPHMRRFSQRDLAEVQDENVYTEQLKSKIDAAIEKSLQDETLVEAIATQWPGKDNHDLIQKWVKGWFEHDLVISRLGEEQQWCIE